MLKSPSGCPMLLAQEAPSEALFLYKIGVPWNKDSDGTFSLRLFGGMSKPRTLFVKDKTGFYILTALYKHAKSFSNIAFYEEHLVTKLVVKHNVFYGVTALDMCARGKPVINFVKTLNRLCNYNLVKV